MDIIRFQPILSGNFASLKIIVNNSELTSKGNVPDLFNIRNPLRYIGTSTNKPIFNCSCGIAECGGIEMSITSTEDNVIWRMQRPQKFSYIFDREQYREAFKTFQAELKVMINGDEKLLESAFFKNILKDV